MKILVVGGGGREHAIIKKLKENPAVTEIFALPGNGGISADATCVPIGATDLDGIVQFVKEHPVDYACLLYTSLSAERDFMASTSMRQRFPGA